MKPTQKIRDSREYQEREAQARARGDEWADDEVAAHLAHNDDSLWFDSLECDPLAFLTDSPNGPLPKSLDEAMQRPELWQEAVEKELAKMREYNVWDVVPLPKGAELMDYRWVFAEKFDGDGSVIGRKARLVGKGYSQRFGVNFLWTSAAVVRLETV